MKSKIIALVALSLVLSAAPAAQEKQRQKSEPQKPPAEKAKPGERLEADDSSAVPSGVSEELLANRREQMNEDAEGLLPSYNNFMTTYRLGPEDVISINVFGQPRYDRANVTVPPDGRVDYFFIPDGLSVVGKTTRQVRDEITAHLEEYIIDPKVNVSLEKALSYRYGVIGDVAKPGIMLMSRRLSVLEALYDAGGVLPTGDKSKVVVLRWNADRTLQRIPVDIAAIEKGKAPDNYFLRPGDQIFVPGNRWKTVDKIMKMMPVLSFARIFTGGW